MSVFHALHTLHTLNEQVHILSQNLVALNKEFAVIEQENESLKQHIIEKDNTIMQLLETQLRKQHYRLRFCKQITK